MKTIGCVRLAAEHVGTDVSVAFGLETESVNAWWKDKKERMNGRRCGQSSKFPSKHNRVQEINFISLEFELAS